MSYEYRFNLLLKKEFERFRKMKIKVRLNWVDLKKKVNEYFIFEKEMVR